MRIPAPALANINQTEFYLTQENPTDALVLDYDQVQPNAVLAIWPNVIELSDIIPNSDGTFSKTIADPCPQPGPRMVELTNPDFQSVSVAYYCHVLPPMPYRSPFHRIR